MEAKDTSFRKINFFSYDKQKSEHLAFLRAQDLDIDTLAIDTENFVQCPTVQGKTAAYKIIKKVYQDTGLVGLYCLLKLPGNDEVFKFKTYGRAEGDGPKPRRPKLEPIL